MTDTFNIRITTEETKLGTEITLRAQWQDKPPWQARILASKHYGNNDVETLTIDISRTMHGIIKRIANVIAWRKTITAAKNE